MLEENNHMSSDPTQSTTPSNHDAPTPRDAFISTFGRGAGIACIVLAFITCALTVTTISNDVGTHGPYYIMAFIFINIGVYLLIIGNKARKKIDTEAARLFEEERQRRRQKPLE